MSITDREALAGLRVLVAVAKADGVIKEEERDALVAAVESAPGITVDDLLEHSFDLAAELRELRSQDAKESTYRSAHTLAYADGDCSDEEKRLLDLVRAELALDDKHGKLVDRLFSETKDTVLISSIKPIADPDQRSKAIRQDTYKYSVLSAVLGAFPVPGIAIALDLAVVALQMKLVSDIGRYYGHAIDKQAAKKLLLGLGVGTGARIAVTNLVKFVPIWGSVLGAASAFAATFALGKVMDKHFAQGGAPDADISGMKSEFKAAEKEGKKAYEANKEAIEAKKQSAAARLDQLNVALERGEITQAEYERQAAELA